MKNKLKILKIITLTFLILFNSNKLFAKDIVVDAEVVDIKDNGNIILASGKVSIVDGISIKINGDKSEYNREKQIVEIFGNVLFFDKNKNYKVISDKILFDRNNNTISSFGNTKIILLDKFNKKINFEIKGNDSFFDQNKKQFEIKDNVKLKDNINNLKLSTEKITYDQSSEIFKSFGKTDVNFKKIILQ